MDQIKNKITCNPRLSTFISGNVMNLAKGLFKTASIFGRSSNVIEFNTASPTSHLSRKGFLYFWQLRDQITQKQLTGSCFGLQVNEYVAGQRLYRFSLPEASISICCIFPSATRSHLAGGYSLAGPRLWRDPSEGAVGSGYGNVLLSFPTVAESSLILRLVQAKNHHYLNHDLK